MISQICSVAYHPVHVPRNVKSHNTRWARVARVVRRAGSVLLHLSQLREPERTISRKGDDAFVARYCAEKADLWQRAAAGCEHGCSCEEATAPAARLLSSVVLCMSTPAEILEIATAFRSKVT